MAKHARVRTDEQRERLERNREKTLSVLMGNSGADGSSTQTAGITLTLERMATRQDPDATVPYEGPAGIERLLAELANTYRGGEVFADGHLAGLRGMLGIEGHDEPISLSVSVSAGAQLRLEVGPSSSIEALLDAIRVFDRQFHLACVAIGHEYELMAQGYNPHVTSPSDIVAVPFARYVLLNTYLSRTGRYARDALRCTASTTVRLPLRNIEQDAVEDYRICAALAPLVAFLTDNSLRLRGSDPHEPIRMIRSLVWGQVDATRCGLVPGTFGPRFGFSSYERWVEGVRPIVLTNDEGLTFSTGTDTCQRVMEERELSDAEVAQLLDCALPDVRWNGGLELRTADALPLRMAGGLAALFKGILATEESRAATRALISLDDIDEGAVERAWHDLRELGWQTRVYGRPVGQIADELAALASRQLPTREERRLLDALAQLWEVRMVPRDTLLRNWERNRPRTVEEEAIELYGEGAVIPFDELGGEPPAGQTAVMPALR